MKNKRPRIPVITKDVFHTDEFFVRFSKGKGPQTLLLNAKNTKHRIRVCLFRIAFCL